MIIDADTHIAPTGGEFTLEKQLARMERAGIDKALTWLKPDYVGEGIEGHLRFVYDSVQAYPDRLLGFGWADPTAGVDHAKRMVKLCTEEYGFHGVKLNGAQNDYAIDDPEIALPVVEEIAKTGKLLAFHIGPDAYENTHPLRARKIALMYPEMTILMVHMGMTDPAMAAAVVEVALECPNVTLIGSATNDKLVLRAINQLGADRVCFGTDAPFQRPHVVRAWYEAMLEDDVTEVEREMVMGGNTARLFEL